ncbi:MAG: hypothetical protein GYB26_10060 [Gammaproteobacteria bacterium]|nr:hypothetical protein [Gammaproteobacteria bacterium]
MNNPTPTIELSTAARPRKRRRRVDRTQEQWKAMLNVYDNSGLTKAEFCKQQGIATSSLQRWLKFFRDQSQPSSPFIDITESLSSATPGQTPATDDTRPWQVELELGNGVTLRVRAI